MGGFFKRLFKANEDNTDEQINNEVLDQLADDILAEETEMGSPSIETTKLPDIPGNAGAEDCNEFWCYKFYSSSNAGMVRESNQDSTFTGEFIFNTNGQRFNLGMGIVADGMGGLSAGEVASAAAITSVSTFMNARMSEYLQHGIPTAETILINISSAIQNANKIVLEKGNELNEDIGTTFTFGFFIRNNAYFGHVGDSRAYFIDIENSTIEKITKDHSLVGRLIELGQLSEKDAKSHPRRNEIYRMLGLRENVQVDTYYRCLNKNSVIVMVSDGLWEFVDDDEILKEVLKTIDFAETPEKLIQLANSRGGDDNISVVIIKPEYKN